MPQWILMWCSNKMGVSIVLTTRVHCCHCATGGGIYKQQ